MKFPNLARKALLSPMADINDVAFRMLCKEYGCALTYTQMVSANLAAKKNKSTLSIIDVIPEEKPYGIQLFGQDAVEISNAAIFIEEEYSPAVIDLNMGCPARKIMSQGSGSALLIKPEKIAQIVKKTSSSINTPFTVKIRLGQSEKNITAFEVAKICEDNGAAALAVHGRTAEQGYSGKADWSMIKQIKDTVSIPVIGNGDINTPEDAKRMLEETNCDFFMLARAAMKGPFVFKQINDFLERGSFEKTNSRMKNKMVVRYVELAEKLNIPYERVKIHAQHFTTGDSGGSVVRDKLSTAKSIEEIIIIIGLS
jgi:tRNA-dihydrouridine synthase B